MSRKQWMGLAIGGVLTAGLVQAAPAASNDYLPEVRLSSGDITVDYSGLAGGAPNLSSITVESALSWTWRNNYLHPGELPSDHPNHDLAINDPFDLSTNCLSVSCGKPSQLGNTAPDYTTTYPFLVSAGKQIPGPFFTADKILYPAEGTPAGIYTDYDDHIQLYGVNATTMAAAQSAGSYFEYSVTSGNYSPDYELSFSGTTFKQSGEDNTNFMKYSRQILISEDSSFSNYHVLTEDSDTQSTFSRGEAGPMFLISKTPLVAKPNTKYYIRIYFYNPTTLGTTKAVGQKSIYLDDFGPLITVKTVPDVVTYTEGDAAILVDKMGYAATVLDNPNTVPSTAATAFQSVLLAAYSITKSDTLAPDSAPSPVTSDVATLKIQAKNIQDGDKEVITVGGISFPLNTSKSGSDMMSGLSYTYDGSTKLLTVTGGNASTYQSIIRGVTYQNISSTPTATTSADANTVHPGPGQFSNTQRILNFTVLDKAGQESNISPAYINVKPINLGITKSVDHAYIKVADANNNSLPLPSGPLIASKLDYSTLTYTLTVKNDEASPANNVVVTDVLPVDLSYVTGSVNTTVTNVDKTTSSGRDYLKFSIGTVAAGETKTITFQATTEKPSPPTDTTLNSNTNAHNYINEAKVYGNITNLTAIDNTTVPIYPMGESEKVITDVIYTKLLKLVNNITNPTNPVWKNSNTALPNDTLQYCINFYNFGTKDLSNYSVTDNLPPHTKYVDNSLTVTTGSMDTPGTAMTATKSQPAADATTGTVKASGFTLGAGTQGTMCFKVVVQ